MATDNTTTNQIWQHRLLQLDYLPAGELARRFNLLNPRSHPESQKDATETSLEKVQWIDEISLSTNGDGPPSLADNPDAVLFDGHERVEIVLSRFGPDALVPVKWYRLTKEETDFALLVKDQATGMAEYIPERLVELMERTRAMTADSRLAGMLERLKAQAGVNGKGTPKDAEPQIDRAAQLKEKWGVCLGQVWELPSLVDGRPHRIVCGDCTDRETVERVMGGEKAELIATSPPYFVGKDYEKDLSWEEFLMLIGGFIATVQGILIDGGYLFINFSENTNKPSIMAEIYRRLSVENGMQWHSHRVWKRPADLPIYASITPRPCNEIEYLHTYRKPGGSEKMRDIKISSRMLWETGGPERLGHSAAFSVELIANPIKIYTDSNAIIYDPFLGSGTTLIAAHNLGRICYGCELDEGYTGVILERYHKATGLLPTLIDQGAR